MAACGLETGKIYLWTVNTPQRWSALAPDFAEVEENVEYIEHEDEFDIHPISVIQQRRLDLEDEDVDVVRLGGSSATTMEASSSSSSVDKDRSMISQTRSSKRNPLVDDNRHTNNHAVNDRDDEIPFRMPVLLDISESESEEEIVPVGPGTMRRKSPGQGKEWLIDTTSPITLDDHIYPDAGAGVGAGNTGNGDGIGIGRSTGTPTTTSTASGPEIVHGNVGPKKPKRRRG